MLPAFTAKRQRANESAPVVYAQPRGETRSQCFIWCLERCAEVARIVRQANVLACRFWRRRVRTRLLFIRSPGRELRLRECKHQLFRADQFRWRLNDTRQEQALPHLLHHRPHRAPGLPVTEMYRTKVRGGRDERVCFSLPRLEVFCLPKEYRSQKQVGPAAPLLEPQQSPQRLHLDGPKAGRAEHRDAGDPTIIVIIPPPHESRG